MSRDGRLRDDIGGGGLSSVRIIDINDAELELNKLIQKFNELKQSINSKSNRGSSDANEGADGDIRLYSDTAIDGTTGYFIQGKFGNSWATQRLSLETVNEDAGDTSSAGSSYGEDSFSLDLTSAMVTFENLLANGDIGLAETQVPQGNHTHDHDDIINNGGSGSHVAIQAHMDDGTKHRLANASTTSVAAVKNGASDAQPGSATTWAPSDHEHILDQTISYAFTNQIQVNYNQATLPALSVSNTNASNYAIKAIGKVFINNGSLEVDGDVDIDGDLTVGFAEAAGGDAAISGNTTIAGTLVTTGDISGDEDLSIDKNVFLNGPLTLGAETDTYSTTIFGKTYTKNVVEILHQVSGGEKHLTMKHDGSNWGGIEVDNNGTMLIHATGNIELHSDTDGSSDTTPGYSSILPGDASKVNIGSQLKRFKTLFVDELYAETFVAQEVLATSGGRIIVAPTTKLKADLGDDVSNTTITVEHNNLVNGDFAIMRSSSVATGDGLPVQMEVLEITSSASANGDYWDYTVTRDVDATGRNTWIEGSAVVNFGHELGDGYIEITSTRTLTQNLGPSISMFSRISGSNWDDASLVAHIGDLNGFAGISSTKFGAAFGKNLLAAQNAVSNPFTGMLVDGDSGLQIYNTNIEIYDGSSRNAVLGKDAAGKTVLAVGEGLSETSQGVWANSKLLFAEAADGTYKLTIDGAINITGDTTSWPFLENEADVVAAMSNMTSSGTPSEGFYLADTWIGYYAGTGAQPWPIQIGTTGSNQYAYIGNTDKTNYLEYNSGTLTVKGTIISEATTFAYGSISILGTLDGSTKVVNTSDWGGLSSGYHKASASFYAPLSATKAKVTIRYKDVEASNAHVLLNNVLMTTDGLSVGSNNAVQDVTYTIPEIDSSTETFIPLAGIINYQATYGTDTEILKIDSVNTLDFYNPSGDTDKYEVHYVKIEYEIGSVTEHNTLPNLTNTITIGDGSIIIGNTAGNAIYTAGKTGIDDTDSGFWLGMQAEDIPGFVVGDADAFMKYKEFGLEMQMGFSNRKFKFTSSEFSLENLNLTLNSASTDIFIGSDLSNSDLGNIVIGRWGNQSNSSNADNGILVKHGTNDYSKMGSTGFNRRGFDYPINIYNGGMVGWLVNGAFTTGGADIYPDIGAYLEYLGYPTYVPAGRMLTFSFNPFLSVNSVSVFSGSTTAHVSGTDPGGHCQQYFFMYNALQYNQLAYGPNSGFWGGGSNNPKTSDLITRIHNEGLQPFWGQVPEGTHVPSLFFHATISGTHDSGDAWMWYWGNINIQETKQW